MSPIARSGEVPSPRVVSSSATSRRRDEHAGEIGQRGRADRGRYVAARDRRERDRRLHRRRQTAQVEQAGVERRRGDGGRQRLQGEPEQREQRERAGQHQQVQLPVRQSGEDRFARQPRAVQEEQHGDAGDRQMIERHRHAPLARQQRGERHGGEQGEGEAVEEGAQEFHEDIGLEKAEVGGTRVRSPWVAAGCRCLSRKRERERENSSAAFAVTSPARGRGRARRRG